MNPAARLAGPLLLPLFLLRAELPAAGELLPDDTLAAVHVPDATIARATFGVSNIGRLWDDAAMRPFRTNFEAGFRTRFAEAFARESGIDLVRLAETARGPVTLALLRNGWSGKEDDDSAPAWVMAFDAKDRAGALGAVIAESRARLAAATNHPVRTYRIHDVEFTAVTLDLKSADAAQTAKARTAAQAGEDDADDEEDTPVEFAYGRTGGVFVAGTSPTALKRLMERLVTTNNPPGLGARPAFARMHRGTLSGAEAWAFVDVGAFYERLAPGVGSVFGMLAMLGADPAKVVPATGLGSVKAVGLGLRNTPGGQFADLVVDAPQAERAGLTKVFETLPMDASPPPFVPGGAVDFLRWRIDGKASWKSLDDALRRISPQIAGLATLTLESAGQVFDADFNLQRDIAGNLGDDFISFALPPGGSNLPALAAPPKVQLIGSPRPERLLSGFKALEALMHMQSGALNFSERTNAGVRILSGRVAAKGVERDVFHMAALTNYLVLADDPTTLDALIAGGTNTMAALPEWAEAARGAGGTTNGMFGLALTRERMRPLWEGLRTAESLDRLVLPGTTAPEAVKAMEAWADFRLLPSFDVASRYWTVSAVSGGSGAEGFRFRWFVVGAR